MKFEFSDLQEGLELMATVPDAVLLDVRTPEEFCAGHIPGSVNWPLERISLYDGGEPVFAYCRSGARSARACSLLEQMGYEAVNLGGLNDYRGNLEK